MSGKQGNLDRVTRALGETELDCILITSPPNRLFATGFTSSAGLALVTGRGAWFFTDSRYYEAAGAAITGARVMQVSGENGYSDAVRSVMSEQGLHSVGVEDESMTYGEYARWRERLGEGVRLVAVSELMESLRAVKSAGDLEGLKRAQRVAERSFEQVLPLIVRGMTEKELAAELIYRFLRNGADDKSFDPIVVSGARSSLPHGVPSDNAIGDGFLTIDFGVRLDGWCSDTTRTLCVGEPTAEMRDVYDTVLRAQLRGIETARAGVVGKDIDAAARAVITDAGYGDYFGHGFGHGLGLEIHEPPNAAPSNDQPLPAGAVISAEPGIYIPGRFGVRIEDVLYLTQDGCENITSLPKELTVLRV
jgi:Xaa-Pro aminopeptidase